MKLRWMIASGVVGAALGLAVGYADYRSLPGEYVGDFFRWAIVWHTDALSWMAGGIIAGVSATVLLP